MSNENEDRFNDRLGIVYSQISVMTCKRYSKQVEHCGSQLDKPTTYIMYIVSKITKTYFNLRVYIRTTTIEDSTKRNA